MRDANGIWVGWAKGDRGAEVVNIKNWLRPRYEKSGSDQLNASDTYDDALVAVVTKLRQNVKLPASVNNTLGVWDWAVQAKLGYKKPASGGPVQGGFGNATLFIIPGTWAGPHDGPPAWVYDWVDKSRFKAYWVEYLARGFLTPDPNTSYEESLADGIQKTIEGINRTPGKIILIGYSQGADVAVHVMKEFEPNGRLSHRRGDLIRVVGMGNPGRPSGPDFLGRTFPGNGISGVYPAPDMAHLLHSYDFPQDMYANSNAIMKQFYSILTKMELSVNFAMACLQLIGGVIPLFGTAGTVLGGGLLTGLFGTVGNLTQRLAAVAPGATQQQALSITAILSDLPGVAFALQQLMGFMSTQAHSRYGGSEAWLDFDGTDAVRHAAAEINRLRF